MSRDAEVLIVGGGLNGCCLALALAQNGISVALIDAQTDGIQKNPSFDGRSYALALASQRLLTAIGVWGGVAHEAQPIRDIYASDGHAGQGAAPFFLHFDHAEIEEGPMGYMVEDRHLRRALLSAVSDAKPIRHIQGKTVVGQDVAADAVRLTLDDGSALSGDLLIGCDGRKSGTAKRAGIRRRRKDYGQTALVCAIAHERPHEGAAHQFFMPSGPLAILPLKGDRSSIVWTESHEMAAGINALSEADYLTVLQPRFGDFLGEIALDGKRFSYPLDLTLAERIVDSRLALVGDAAHGVHPIAGQGLNLGLRDIGALVEVLVSARRRGEDIASTGVLERYAEWRGFDTNALVLATDAFNTLFSNDNPILRPLRDIGMGLVNAAPGLRRRFMREAAGLTGDLPRLMQGRPL